LGVGKTAHVGDKTYTKQQCFVQALTFDAGVAVPYAGCDIYIVASDPYLDLTTQVPLLVPSLQQMIVLEPWKNHAGMRRRGRR